MTAPIPSLPRLLLVAFLGLCCPSLALSTFAGAKSSSSSRASSSTPTTLARTQTHINTHPHPHHYRPPSTNNLLLTAFQSPLFVRGGGPSDVDSDTATITDDTTTPDDDTTNAPHSSSTVNHRHDDLPPTAQVIQAEQAADAHPPASFLSAVSVPMMSSISTFATWYAASLDARPIFTKSATAGIIFTLSDYLAQKVEASQKSKSTGTSASSSAARSKPSSAAASATAAPPLNLTRLFASAVVGFCYFGPAAHYWYEWIFALLPGTSLASTLEKAALGQLIFGPAFTCVFFASALLQSHSFTPRRWWRKIRADLPGAWLAGVGFWPLVDLAAYSMVPPQWIPLFINACSLAWTIYLSLVANRGGGEGTGGRK